MKQTGGRNVAEQFPRGSDAEPWVELPNGSDLRNWAVDAEILYNQTNRQLEKYRFFVSAFDFIKENQIPGEYFEFGCHRARTFRMALTEARRHFLDSMRFFAFDSFEGLPQAVSSPSHRLWRQPGSLVTTEDEFLDIVRKHGIYADRITTIKGFYNQSLTAELQGRLAGSASKIALACIDCDLYESARSVFAFIEPFLQEGSLLYVDDVFVGYRGSPAKGVARAFVEFQKSSTFRFVPHMNVGWWGRSYIAFLPDANFSELSRDAVI